METCYASPISLPSSLYFSCSYYRGRSEDCVVLARSLVCLATWTLTTATQTILRLVELRDSKVRTRVRTYRYLLNHYFLNVL
jgi:hypothetical protein